MFSPERMKRVHLARYAPQKISTKMPRALVTGGLGYIGSHTVVALIFNGWKVDIIDKREDPQVLNEIQTITGQRPRTFTLDLAYDTDDTPDLLSDSLELILIGSHYDAVLHFAAFKSVAESVKQPLMYYHNNLVSTMHLLQKAVEYGIPRFIFSSSAAVYGEAHDSKEDQPLSPPNPYAHTKAMIEQILRDVSLVSTMQITSLRYFNPIGSWSYGLLSDHSPENLMPRLMKVAQGVESVLPIYGSDYETPDGTAIRDFVDVDDVAQAHVLALSSSHKGYRCFNIGSGQGSSVLEVVRAMENALETKIPIQFCARRAGDVARLTANTDRAKHELGWSPDFTLQESCSTMKKSDVQTHLCGSDVWPACVRSDPGLFASKGDP